MLEGDVGLVLPSLAKDVEGAAPVEGVDDGAFSDDSPIRACPICPKRMCVTVNEGA